MIEKTQTNTSERNKPWDMRRDRDIKEHICKHTGIHIAHCTHTTLGKRCFPISKSHCGMRNGSYWSQWSGWHGHNYGYGGWQWPSNSTSQSEDGELVKIPDVGGTGGGRDAGPDDGNKANDHHEMQVKLVQQEKDLFWLSEEGVRLRSSTLTGFEKHQLMKHTWVFPDNNSEDPGKVCQHFGGVRGPNRAVRRLLLEIQKSKNYQPGEKASIRTPDFVLCKHVMLAGWKQWQACFHMPGDGMPSDVFECYCFPATSLMIQGCSHKKAPVYGREYSTMNNLCSTCSTCLRCGG